MTDKICPACGNCTPEYLLGCDWKDDLREMLCKLDNIHYLTDAEYMTELELFALFISLKDNNK